ncbi:general secretion pathway protein H [Hoeflea marina]|uniref:Type II secretion system protein H n=1 Tax=Hoeflea marina TaxID=274592 RepID=A0A317PMI2_9HYPH|nr:GspH/FimT family pseudopilin [Hoeflea marina]PWW01511.1 general secretion pathway protein H [Hoeflea marina]
MRARSEPHWGDEAGFTLIEMMVVLAVIAMASLGVVAYGVNRDREPTSRALAQSTALLAHRASQAAVTRGLPVRLRVDLEAGVISLDAGKKQDVVRFSADSAGARLATGRGLVASPGVGEIVFLPDGSATGGEIRFQRQGQPAYRVRIHWLTGAVSYGEAK